MKALLIAPQFPDTYWSFRHAVRFAGKRATFPPLGLLTVAAMLPRAWERRLVDMNVRPLRATDIAELFGLAPRTVTESLDALERAGLLRREADPADRRVKRISITEEGRRAITATEPLRLKP